MLDPYAFEERAAIREFDAGFSRAKAEWLARADLQQASEAARRDRLASLTAASAAQVPQSAPGARYNSQEAPGTPPVPS